MAKQKTSGNTSRSRSTRSTGSHNVRAGSSRNRHNSQYKKNTSRRPSGNHSHKALKKRPILKYILLTFLGLFMLGVAGLGVAYAMIKIPSPESIALNQKTTVYYNDATTQIGSFQEQNRQIIECSALPDYVGNAVVASENRTFWTDSGIDFKGIGRALFNNITTGSRQGGSTITQQYAERYYLGDTKSYVGKLKEALLALKIAQTQDKSTVLCGYLNTIYWGRGAYGIQAAAQAYFGKDAKDLTVEQAAMLAGIIPAPSLWDPAVDQTAATKRFNRVIKIMKTDGYITSEQASAAAFPETIENTNTDQYAGDKGYLLTMVKNELIGTGKFTEDQIMTGGYSIVTTIDKDKQATMQNTVNGDSTLPATIEVGGMSADVDTGEILAVYGGRDYNTKQLNNATQAIYQAGSTMKVFTLLGAIQQGVNLNTIFNGNSPQSFPGIAQPVANYGNRSYGYISLTQALAHSVNTVFMHLNEKVTPQKTAQIAQEAGITSSIQTDSLYNTLGIDAVHMSEMVQAYQTIAHDGVRNTLHIVRSVTSASDGNTMYAANTTGKQVFDSNTTAVATQALRAVVTSGTGTPALSVGKTLAGKSGTANDSTALSFVGFSRHVVTGFAIWNPSDDGKTNEAVPSFGAYREGTGYPTHLFADYMKQALAGVADEAFPTAKTQGAVGGSDGSWGLGRPQIQRENNESQEDKKESNESGSKNSTEQPSQSPNDSQNTAPQNQNNSSGQNNNNNNGASNPSNEQTPPQNNNETNQSPSTGQPATGGQ
ncbi:transglycosylase domain-containing protein [Alloscardovia omnicolens]|uniref:transglycosylase domain-containing protein n=1 Tax=Alloscardovia omnicolens TaxID=419015 RepID=UPI003A5E77EB